MKSAFSSPDFNIIEQRAGASVKATRVDSPIEEAIHSANCLNIRPVIPPINDTGTNTAINTSEVAKTAPNTSFIVISVAVLGSFPSCICRCVFSSTTIASSTTKPTARTRPNKINRFIENPNKCIKINTPIKETGIAQKGINAARAVPKNK